MIQANPNLNLKHKKIHFIGIGGIGMSALARYLFKAGSVVSGSDKEDSGLIKDLKSEGITNIWTPHDEESIKKACPDLIIYSTAIDNTNKELIWAKENNKEIIHRSELLQLITSQKKLISVSGTHGKTTTTGMIAEMLLSNNQNPSVILGGILESKNTNSIFGSGDYFVTEADESDKSFLKGDPEISVITNIEPDHLENYPGGLEEIKLSFLEFAKKSINKMGLVVCLQDKITNNLITKNFDLNNPKLISYGINTDSKEIALKANLNKKSNNWEVSLRGKHLFSLKLKKPGNHNILNALAAIAIGNLIGLSPENIKTSLENYNGVKRRFQILKRTSELTIVDDYAHHPTEIIATIKAAKELFPKRLVIIFQPHQPRRLQDFWEDFINSFKEEDFPVFITDIYVARGKEIQGISSKKLVQEIAKPNVNHLPGNIEEISKFLSSFIKEEDFILIMGAGDITNLGPQLIKETCMKFREQLI